MDITIDFETYWEKIGGDIHFANRKAATEREWARHPDKEPDEVKLTVKVVE